MRILIIRHADPEYAGDTLTEHGHKEAAALAKSLCAARVEGEGKLTRLFSSPMGRARDTARYTEEASGLTAETLEWTRELTYWPRPISDWNIPKAGRENSARAGEGGLALWDIPGEIVRATRDLTVKNEFERVPGILPAKEFYEDLCAKSDQFVESLGYKREEDGTYSILRGNRDTIAVFCHGGFGVTWMARLLSMPATQSWTSFYLAPSSVTTILFDERSKDRAVPRAISVGSTGHLYAAGLKTQNSKYERPNVFSSSPRPSGVKANFF